MKSEIQQKEVFPNSPKWVSDAIVYQIFPDRFRRSGRVGVSQKWTFKRWGSQPSKHGFYGGDLYGVIDMLDYLEEIGINCIYLNPVFSSVANHRYHTFDYFQVDPILGGNSALDDLISALHSRGMRIILDGVFNHCGRGFWAFHHLLENGKDSPYKNWFCVHNWPIIPYPKCQEDCGYSCWWNDPALPKFNHKYAPVRDYLISVAVHWLKRGIDGWRLDVPDEVPADFWVDFRKNVKAVNPEAWIVGEIWGDARRWLTGDQFDGVMNYRIGWSTLCWTAGNKLNKDYLNPAYPLVEISSEAFINILETTRNWYSKEVNNSNMNLLDSHDVPRALNTLLGDIPSLKIALALLFFQPGAPCIFYGTEVGLSGGEEPSCRECFPWDELMKVNLSAFIRSLVDMRKNLSGYFSSGIEWKLIEDDGLVGRSAHKSLFNSDKRVVVFVNRSRTNCMPISIDPSVYSYYFLSGMIDRNNMTLGPQSIVLFHLVLESNSN